MLQNLFIVLIFGALAFGTNAKPQPQNPIDGRIIGGFEAKPHQFPYQVALNITMKGTGQFNFCGGSLILDNYVLTAAHCVVIAEKIDVILGAREIDVIEPSQIVLNSNEFIIPEEYSSEAYEWDLALIKLPEPAEFNEYIQPVALAEGNDTYAGDVATVAGWGVQWGGQATIELILRYAENVIVSNRECVKNDPVYKMIVKDSHICQATYSYAGSCHGDSGGALILDEVQIGIVSLGYDNCFLLKPVIFTRFTSYRNWIKKNADI